MSILTSIRSIHILYVIFVWFFFQNDLAFFLNPELIVNAIFFTLCLLGFYCYYNMNQKGFLFQKNEMRKKNVIFFQAFITNLKRLQVRNRHVRRVYILKYLYDLLKAVDAEVMYQKTFLEHDLKAYIVFYMSQRLIAIRNRLNDSEKIIKSFKAMLLNSWFLNRHSI